MSVLHIPASVPPTQTLAPRLILAMAAATGFSVASIY